MTVAHFPLRRAQRLRRLQDVEQTGSLGHSWEKLFDLFLVRICDPVVLWPLIGNAQGM